MEDKTDVLEEGELAAWFLNEMDQATQTDPVPYAPVDRPGVWMCPLHPDEHLSEGRKNEFVYVYCPRNTCPVFSPQDRVDEWMTLVTQQLHEEFASTMGRVDLFLRSTVGVAQERVGEESSTHVLGLSRWRLPLFPVVEPPVVGQDASSRPWRRLEQPPPQGQTRLLGRPNAGRGRVDDQGVYDV